MSGRFIVTITLLAVLCFSGCLAWNSDYDVVASPTGKATLQATTISIPERGYNFSLDAHVAIMKGPSSVFSIMSRGCGNHTVLSVLAKEHGCTYATNGGFFAFVPPGCVGNVIINKTWFSNLTNEVPSIGVRSSDKAYIMGHINLTDINNIGFDYLLSGMVWLVRGGKSYLNISSIVEGSGTGFLTEKAPRTAIGLDRLGNLYLIEVDGQENIYKGMDLYEFTDLILSLGIYNAVNVDGGGSSESYYMGEIISKPTCVDNSTICERPLGTATCLIL